MSSVYHQTKHKRISGLVNAQRASKCFNCGALAPAEDIFKGWCVSCIAAWGATADPVLVEQARLTHMAQCQSVPEPPTARSYERLKNRIAERRPDEWFIPMTLFVGNYTVGQAQANWNFLQALKELEVMTTAQAFKIGQESHDLLHICGRHAPMQSSSLASFMGRVIHSEDNWKTIEPELREYIRDFISQQGIGFKVLTTPRRRISRYAAPGVKTKRQWRVDPNRKTRAQKKSEQDAFTKKWGDGVIKPAPNFWPFAVRQAPTEHEMLHAIDRATRGIPEQWRQDVCQDLVVAVLSGETTLDNLRDAIPEHIKRVFKMHPIKYGDKSLDSPIWGFNGSRTLGDVLAQIEQEDREDRDAPHAEPDRCGWHAGFDRPVGLADMGEMATFKHGS